MASVDLQWNGDAIVDKYRQAQKLGVAEVAALCVVDAARNTPVRTGTAQGSVRAEPPKVEGNAVSTIWGSFDVNYYIWLELRGNMLRNAADRYYGRLAEAISKRAKQMRLGGTA